MANITVKLCGLSTPQVIGKAIALQADYLGFVCHPASPRHLEPLSMAALIDEGNVRGKSVAVLVDPDDALLAEIMGYVKPAMLQLHGNETPQRLAAIRKTYPNVKLIKAFSIREAADLEPVPEYETLADLLLFDAKPPKGGLPGGNGAAFDWALLAGKKFAKPWLLSGGLTAENVAEALRISGAQGVDVSSGIESAPGVKDEAKMEAFVKAVRGYEQGK